MTLQELVDGHDEQRPLTLSPVEYNLTEPLVIDHAITIDGNGATIIAAAAMEAVVILRGAIVEIRNCTIHGGRNADVAMLVEDAGQSEFSHVVFMRGRRDAVLVTDKGNNDCMQFHDCVFQHTGGVFTGEASTTVGVAPIVSWDDGQFLTRGVRRFDHICVAGEWLQVDEVLSESQLRCALHPPSAGVSGAASLHVGDGYREMVHNDNNLIVLEDCLFRGCGGSGASFHGLYGPRVVRGQSDFNAAFGFSVGGASGSNVITSSFRDCYTEENGARSFFLGYAAGITIDTFNCPDGPEPWLLSNPTFNWGVARNVQGSAADMPIGNYETTLPVSRFVVRTTPPTPPLPLPMGYIWLMRSPFAGQPIGYVKDNASPYSSWSPFGKVE